MNLAILLTTGEEWVARVEEWRMNVADGKFKNLEETESIRKELEGRQRAEFEMKGGHHFLGVLTCGCA